MKRSLIIIVSIFTLLPIFSINAQKNAVNRFKLSSGIITGYNGGYGVQANFTVHKPAQNFPLELRFGLGYNFMDPGNALEARRIFINNNTNGTPEKSGRSIDYRLDFLFPKSIFGLKQSYIVLGPRGASFKGNFQYIGGNEDFDVISHQWGLGGGIESHFDMARNLAFVISVGLDYYLPGTLHGHDTSYSPDGDNVNPRNDNENNDTPFTYKDANEAIYQPAFMPYAMIGLTFNL